MRATARLVANDTLQALVDAPAGERGEIVRDSLSHLDDETRSVATGMIISDLLDRVGSMQPATTTGADVAYAAIDVVHDVLTHTEWTSAERANRLLGVFPVPADQARVTFTVATLALDLAGTMFRNAPADEAQRWREAILPLAIELGEEQSAARALLDETAGECRRSEGN